MHQMQHSEDFCSAVLCGIVHYAQCHINYSEVKCSIIRCIELHYGHRGTVRYIALHYITLYYSTVQCIPVHYTVQFDMYNSIILSAVQ